MECESGSRGYDKGESPATALNEIVVRNIQRANYYHGKACALGEPLSCYVLAGRYLDGEGIRQDAATAARMYSTICNGREYVKAATEASCARLGVLYAKGDRVPLKFREGVALLKRACEMGDDYGCKERNLYGGTGRAADVPGPGGAFGFTFG